LFLSVASQPLAGKSGEAWATEILSGLIDPCGAGSEPVTIDGSPGMMGLTCLVALSWIGDRGYLTWLNRSGDEPWLDGIYDRDWFKEILATITLDPGAATP
jgi:hypothetical protein